VYPFFLPLSSFYPFSYQGAHFYQKKLSAPKGEFLEPPKSFKPIIASGYELHPDFVAMDQEQTFSRYDDENP
jgi:hypothetical protein